MYCWKSLLPSSMRSTTKGCFSNLFSNPLRTRMTLHVNLYGLCRSTPTNSIVAPRIAKIDRQICFRSLLSRPMMRWTTSCGTCPVQNCVNCLSLTLKKLPIRSLPRSLPALYCLTASLSSTHCILCRHST